MNNFTWWAIHDRAMKHTRWQPLFDDIVTLKVYIKAVPWVLRWYARWRLYRLQLRMKLLEGLSWF